MQWTDTVVNTMNYLNGRNFSVVTRTPNRGTKNEENG